MDKEFAWVFNGDVGQFPSAILVIRMMLFNGF